MFDKLYRGEPTFEGGPKPTGIPWDVGQAQPRLMELEALGGISGEVLDIGCGLGDNAIFLASRGYSVTGLDGSAAAIEEARGRAAAAGVQVRFEVADATNLTGYDGRFDTVVDSALYHCLDDVGRQAYAAGLHRATRLGACCGRPESSVAETSKWRWTPDGSGALLLTCCCRAPDLHPLHQRLRRRTARRSSCPCR